MQSKEINERLTGVTSDAPAGALLRHYWHPLCPADELGGKRPLKLIEILGERIVVFRSQSGNYIAHSAQCPHRGVSLEFGFIEGESIRCSYHGWLFDRDGGCLEMPFEPRKVSGDIRIRSYSVVERAGILFIYMGPAPIAQFPEWDILNREDGSYEIQLQEDLQCNWFQIQENAADVTHTAYLHSGWFRELGIPDESGFERPLLTYGFQPFEHGIIKSWSYEDDHGIPQLGWGNLLIFPNMLRLESEMHWRVPIDSHRTRIFILRFTPQGSNLDSDSMIVTLPPRKNRDGQYLLDTFFSQDAMAWETQGVIADRTVEHLGASDAGVALFRRMFLAQIDRILDNLQPSSGRSEGDEIIDLREYMGGYLPMSAPPDPTVTTRRSKEDIFDDRHSVFETRPGLRE